ncbi:ABC transporter ATP-binding protein [Fusibacter ferrireducens]|uniref:ABC transporter ATP-binding protein n=1 Tax=Fusibacter ferrireducens TaxID=2785058 RepID=A0ABR9ZM80_9FIRM|nr:ABC transporter ATP-binding protein [Fusibacter ferrireducens]MBF4691573.1 ABC transporter ATP-binding protein [Fusibacter ferrireducens]
MNDKENNNYVLELLDIHKSYGSKVVNDNITMRLKKNEIHALLGENGAGKTTLMNIAYGLVCPDSGKIKVNGTTLVLENSSAAIKNGIGMVHQHFMLIDSFTVLENIVLGRECKKQGVFTDLQKSKIEIQALLEQYNFEIDLEAKVKDISVGMQQKVEIVKMLYRGAKILILDEPTAVLTPKEIDDLLVVLKGLSESGHSIIIITHKLKEIKKSAQRCTIIKHGKLVATVDVKETDEDQLASMMVGRKVEFSVEKRAHHFSKTLFKVDKLCVNDYRGIRAVNNVSFDIREGEILGIAGVDGNGQSELVEAIAGIRKIESGHFFIEGNNITHKKPREIIDSGVSTIPEDRQKMGLILPFNLAFNLILHKYAIRPFSKFGFLNFESIRKQASSRLKAFDVRPDDPNYLASALSGGNQQKLIIARALFDNPKLLIACQPTRGLDVGAIEYIHKMIIEHRNKGRSILLVSHELDEIIDLSDRVLVFYEGKIVGMLEGKAIEERKIGLLMAGGE